MTQHFASFLQKGPFEKDRVRTARLKNGTSLSGFDLPDQLQPHLTSPSSRVLRKALRNCAPRKPNVDRISCTGTMGRPIVQISLKDFDTRKEEIAAELWKAATEIGFFYLKDHDLTAVSQLISVCSASFTVR